MARTQLDVRFRGLRELQRALGKVDKAAKKDVQRKLKDIAESVASDARAVARGKGLVESGDLVSGLVSFARTSGAGVRSRAMHRGYNYPRQLEYERRGGRGYGPNASIGPALERQRNHVFDAAEELLDEIADEFGGRP